MNEHERQADRLDDEAEQMSRQSEELREEIADTREDWHRKQADDSVPGAAGDPPREDDSELPAPEPDETD